MKQLQSDSESGAARGGGVFMNEVSRTREGAYYVGVSLKGFGLGGEVWVLHGLYKFTFTEEQHCCC